jgi:hypothetical protein
MEIEQNLEPCFIGEDRENGKYYLKKGNKDYENEVVLNAETLFSRLNWPHEMEKELIPYARKRTEKVLKDPRALKSFYARAKISFHEFLEGLDALSGREERAKGREAG